MQFGNRAFEDVLTLRRVCTAVGCTRILQDWGVLTGRGDEDTDMHPWGEGHVGVREDIGWCVSQPRGSRFWQWPPEAGKGNGTDSVCSRQEAALRTPSSPSQAHANQTRE